MMKVGKAKRAGSREPGATEYAYIHARGEREMKGERESKHRDHGCFFEEGKSLIDVGNNLLSVVVTAATCQRGLLSNHKETLSPTSALHYYQICRLMYSVQVLPS